MRSLSISRQSLLAAFAEFEVFNSRAFLDVETGETFDVAGDLIDYCRGNTEGTDLQLCDSHDLPRAQAVAEELDCLEAGFDEEGMPFGAEDQRYFPIPRLGTGEEEALAAAVDEWLEEHELMLGDEK